MKRILMIPVLLMAASMVFISCSKQGSGGSVTNFPTRAVECVVPFGAGSASDVFARQYIQIAEKYLGKPITARNLGGAGTTEGMMFARSQPADGYTILEITPSLLIKELLEKTNFRANFEPLLKIQNDLQLFGVSKNSPYKTLDDLIAFAKANPGKIKIGGISPGGLDDYIANGFSKAAGFKWTYVPYASSAEAVAAVYGGELDVYQDKMINFLPKVQAGDIIPLVVLSDESYRNIPGLENCPASKEKGIDFTQGSWRGFVIRKGAPSEVKDILISALQKAYADPAYKAMEEKEMTNLSPGYMEADAWAKEWDLEFNRLEMVFKDLGLIK